MLTCFVAVVSLIGDAVAEVRPQCGGEFRVVTQDSTVFQGELQLSTADSLGLWNSQAGLRTIPRTDVSRISHAYRKWGNGFLLGSLAGAGVGLVWRLSAMEIRPFGEPEDSSNEDWKFYVPILAGAAAGSIIGYHSFGFRQVELEAMPTCDPSSRGEMSMGFRLVVRF
jgi:hypothetical protein